MGRLAQWTNPTGLRCYDVFKVFFYSDTGEEIARFRVDSFCDWEGYGGGFGQGPDVKEPDESEFPCPPTGKDLAENADIQRELDRAYTDSKHGTPKVHEEGGWIYMDREGGLHVVRAEASRVNGLRQINLDNPPKYADMLLVADFHTHPYAKGEPDPDRPGKQIEVDQTKPSTGKFSDTSGNEDGESARVSQVAGYDQTLRAESSGQ